MEKIRVWKRECEDVEKGVININFSEIAKISVSERMNREDIWGKSASISVLYFRNLNELLILSGETGRLLKMRS